MRAGEREQLDDPRQGVQTWRERAEQRLLAVAQLEIGGAIELRQQFLDDVGIEPAAELAAVKRVVDFEPVRRQQLAPGAMVQRIAVDQRTVEVEQQAAHALRRRKRHVRLRGW